MHFCEFLRTSLRRLQGSENLLAFSKRAGIDRAMLARFLADEQGLTSGSIEKLFKNLGYRVFAPDEFVGTAPAAQDIGDYTLIPRVRPFSDLGGLIGEGQGSQFAFRTDFLRGMGFEKNGDMILLEVMGNAMDPTICEKDQVLVSLRETDIYSGQIYVIRVDGELIVKRLTREPGKILVKNDNPAHGGFEIQPDQLNVVGRVRWQGRLY